MVREISRGNGFVYASVDPSQVRVHRMRRVEGGEDASIYGQVTKGARWMPRQSTAMKDVAACEKPRGVGEQTLIRGCPNGETLPRQTRELRRKAESYTGGSETSQYPEEKKA